jgi:maltose phosphorylase
MEFPSDHKRIEKTKLADSELKEWKKVADNMYFPVSKDLGILATRWLLDKELVKDMDATQRPINQNGLGRVCVPHTSNKLMFAMLLFL